MKKLLLTLSLLIVSVVLAGCGETIEILEINEADATSVFDLLEEEGEEVARTN